MSTVLSPSKPSVPTNKEPFYGIKVLVPGDTSAVDIVAIHGLDGHHAKSFTAPQQCSLASGFLAKIHS
ncbi:hypothetical protein BU17DRAFT_102660 [Hysterangium stoloniferum]|nr:hypothetical protein BU17DRAFT_102660 [Hysterangium stoloniferum]